MNIYRVLCDRIGTSEARVGGRTAHPRRQRQATRFLTLACGGRARVLASGRVGSGGGDGGITVPTVSSSVHYPNVLCRAAPRTGAAQTPGPVSINEGLDVRGVAGAVPDTPPATATTTSRPGCLPVGGAQFRRPASHPTLLRRRALPSFVHDVAVHRTGTPSCGCSLLMGHDHMLVRAPDRLWLRCTECGRETPGWRVGCATAPAGSELQSLVAYLERSTSVASGTLRVSPQPNST